MAAPPMPGSRRCGCWPSGERRSWRSRRREGATPGRAGPQADLETQGQYGVDDKQYRVDEASGTILCLVDAPDAETAARVHRKAHGLVADEIYEVVPGE